MSERRYQRTRLLTWSVVAVVACGMIGLILWQVRPRARAMKPPVGQFSGDAAPVKIDPDMESQIAAFCGDCHAVPRPESFPCDRWHDGVRKGYEYYARSGRTDLTPPPPHATVEYFRSLAPTELVFPASEEAQTAMGTKFSVKRVDWERQASLEPSVSHLAWSQLGRDSQPVLLACDMRDGAVVAVNLHQEEFPRTALLARLNQPCRTETCDLDRDGLTDILVADLGSFFAIDHEQGRVVWLRRREGSNSYEEIAVASGFGRIADVRAADLNGDEYLDLLVAEFGHYRTGGICLLQNTASLGEGPRFERTEIDSRPGTIHVPLYDFDRDGRLDFAALVSQEYECVDLFMNRGNGLFQRQPVWAGPDLTFGSSGIELVDLNQDGKMDILYTNGDSFDNMYANPSHGIQWFENLGGLEFAYHRIAEMTGAYRALANDFDLDGDLDVLATAWLPRLVMPASLREAPLPSILLLEQTSPGRFVRHTLERGSPSHAALEVADFDGDGDSDFAVGVHTGMDGGSLPGTAPVAVWWNQAISADK